MVRSPLAWLLGLALVAGSALAAPAQAAPPVAAVLTAPAAPTVVAVSGSTVASGSTTSSLSASAPAQVVVKVASGCTIGGLVGSLGLTVLGGIVPSRGIYRVGSTDPSYVGPFMTLLLLARLRLSRCVVYAEADTLVTVGDTRFHSWPTGDPVDVTPSDWRQQPAAQVMGLDQAHQQATGRGAVVAVLDSGVDAGHPLLAGHVLPGWDYVQDDADPGDERMGVDSDGDGHADAAYGHGTFVAGMALLVAPEAQILPLRVLDSDGVGNVFTVAQAIDDAVAAGATVINLSFGSRVDTRSQVLRDAIRYADSRGAVVVAAAGNDASDAPHYPAAQSEVVAVAAAQPDLGALCDFSARGDWVDVAAPGRDLVGPLPGGLYAQWSGTSMATPLVSGQLALLDSVADDARSDDVIDSVLGSAVAVLGTRVRYGMVDVLGSLAQVTGG